MAYRIEQPDKQTFMQARNCSARHLAGMQHNKLPLHTLMPSPHAVLAWLPKFSALCSAACATKNSSGRPPVLQDYDDDGEAAAGGRLLHLLQMTDARNVCVVVSRWYGGILLGPSRFAISESGCCAQSGAWIAACRG